MKSFRHHARAPFLALTVALVCACGGKATAPSGNLHWFRTCGARLCTPDGGVSNGCVDHKAGDPCTTEGEMCGVTGACEGPLVCAASDPLSGVACPL